MESSYREINYLLFRVVMGINMAVHGAVRIFGEYDNFILRMETMFEPTIIPKVLISIGANIISPLELIFGLFLLVGFRTKETILILTLNMMLLITGVCIIQKWELAGLQMSYVLYLFFIGHYIDFNSISLDKIIENKRNSNE